MEQGASRSSAKRAGAPSQTPLRVVVLPVETLHAQGLIQIVAELGAPTAYPAPGLALPQRCTIDGWLILWVRQCLDQDYSVAGLSDVGRRHKQNVINSSDSRAADREVYVVPPNMSAGFMFRTNEPVFPRMTLSVL